MSDPTRDPGTPTDPTDPAANFDYRYDIDILHLLSSPVHRYQGRPGAELDPIEPQRQDRIDVVERLGIRGDRYFGRPAHVDASVTVMAIESLEWVATALDAPAPFDPLAPRRNVVTRGYPVDSLTGMEFAIDCRGTGGDLVVLQGGRAATPCRWMDFVLAAGAHRALRGRGGVRCSPTSSGVLRIGPAGLLVHQPMPSVQHRS